MFDDKPVKGSIELLETEIKQVAVIDLNGEFYIEAEIEPSAEMEDRIRPEMVELWLCRKGWSRKLFIVGKEAYPRMSLKKNALLILESVFREGDLKESDFREMINEYEVLIPSGEYYSVEFYKDIAGYETSVKS